MSRVPEHYPNAPGFKVSGPSEDAATRVAGSAAVLGGRVLDAFKSTYPQGRTADEIATELDASTRDQFELELTGSAQTSPVGGPVIGQDRGQIGDGRPTAEIIKFPSGTWSPLSTVAAAIFGDMCRVAGGGVACHSIKDGMMCSAAPRHKVVHARRELQEKGLVTLVRAGSEEGPAIWRIKRTRQIAF